MRTIISSLFFVSSVLAQTVTIGPAIGPAGATSGGHYTMPAANAVYLVMISATGTPNHFTWTKNAGSASSPVAIVGGTCATPAVAGSNGWQAITDGVLMCWTSSTGHALNSQWSISATAHGSLSGTSWIHRALGALFRNSEDRMRDNFSLLDFQGCDPTGATDSSACIQNAWNQAGSGGMGGTLSTPCGTYQIALKVTLTSSFKRNLLGSGACTVFKWTGNATDPMFYIVNCDECVIGNFYSTNATPLKYVIWQVQLSGQPFTSTESRYLSIHTQGGTVFPFTSCTNANPVVCTTADMSVGTDPLPGAVTINVSGFTGPWATLNGGHTVTILSATTFSMGADSTTWGTMPTDATFTYVNASDQFSHTTLYSFFYAGCASPGVPTGCIDGNNDQMVFEDVHVSGAHHSGWTLNNTQVFDVLFDHCSSLDANIAVEALNGSFTWQHGNVAYDWSADFFVPSLTADAQFTINDLETENSAQLFNASSGAFPGGGLAGNTITAKLSHITHDGLTTGCTAAAILASSCTPSGHYIFFGRAGGLSIEDSTMNEYGYHGTIFFTAAFNNSQLGPAIFRVSNTTFGYGPSTAPFDIFGTTIADNFFTAGGGSAPSSMDTTSAVNRNVGGTIALGNYASSYAANHLYNLDSIILTAYNATVQNMLIAPSVQAWSTTIGAPTFTGSGSNDAVFSGVQINPSTSTYKTQIYETASLGGPDQWMWLVNGGGTGGGVTSLTGATCSTTTPWFVLYASNSNPVVLNTQNVYVPSGTSITLSGFTGAWTSLNGTFTATNTSNNTFSVPIDSTSFGTKTGTVTMSVGTVTATDAGHGILSAGTEMVNITGASPGGYNVVFAPATPVTASTFTYPVAGGCPASYSSGGSVTAWVGPLPILGSQNPPQNLALPGFGNVGWAGLAVQFTSKTGHSQGDMWTLGITQNQSAAVGQFGVNGGGAAGTGSSVGPLQSGNPSTSSVYYPALDTGSFSAGQTFVASSTGWGVATRSGNTVGGCAAPFSSCSIAPWITFDSVAGATMPSLTVTTALQAKTLTVGAGSGGSGSSGDVVAYRTSTTGAYYFGGSSSSFLFFDGTNYIFGVGGLVSGGAAGVSGATCTHWTNGLCDHL